MQLFPLYNPNTGKVEKPEIPERKTFYRDIAVLAMPADGIVAKDGVIDLTGKTHWDAPAGDWIVYRFGHTTMGTLIQPAQWKATGFECDKMSPEAVTAHMGHVIGEIKRHLGKLVGDAFTFVHLDSYEAGRPGWTPRMREEFAARRGYDMTPFLATFAKRIVGGAEETAKFRADFEDTIKDLYRDVHFALTSKMLRESGLVFSCEPYGGPWRPDEVMPHVHRVMTEFWTSGGKFVARRDLLETVAALRKSGQNIVEAEAFTGSPRDSKWSETPAWLKPIGDGAYCAGVNRLVLHRYVPQPWDDRYKPGNAMGQWGTHFDRTQTWWEPGKAMVEYWRRCQALLQWGKHKGGPGDFEVMAAAPGLQVKAIHRQDDRADVYFVANTDPGAAGMATCAFAVSGKQPELWDPVRGTRRRLPDFEQRDGRTLVPLQFAPAQSHFIVLRQEAAADRGRGRPNFPEFRSVVDITGPWQVSFDSKWGGPEVPVEFPTLEDWTRRPEAGIRHYSGTATYRATFDGASGDRLGLGTVHDLARVRINGRDLGVVWCAPWDIEIPMGLLKPKGNRIEIDVTNTWANRLIGDEQEPPDCEWERGHMEAHVREKTGREIPYCGQFLKRFPDWFVRGEPRPSKGRYCFTTWNYFQKDSPLRPAGLLGPVRLCVASQKPNILFILADDLGWRDTGCYGSALYETPHIDRLAARGLRLTRAYAASPLCSPTRASILTGQDPARIGITWPACHEAVAQLEKKLDPGDPSIRVLNAQSLNRLKPEYFTLAEALREAGYATAHFGKWHLGYNGPYEPKDQGFDLDFPHTPAAPGPAGGYLAPWKFIHDPPLTGEPGEHIEDRMSGEAAKYIQDHKDRPFYLNYWAYSVHAPFNARRDYVERFRRKADEKNPQHNPLYAAMVKSLDDAVGRLMRAVDDAGIADRTIIVFFSDNGGYVAAPKTTDPEGFEGAPVTSNAPLRGGKGSLYEGGTREPCVVIWPGKTEAGATSDALFHSTDFYPTLLGMCGLRPRAGLQIDGVDQSGMFLGQPSPRDRVFCHCPHGNATWARGAARIGLQPGTYVRRGDWKLIRFFADNEDGSDCLELYNLKDDPGETDDLASARPELVRELNALISGFLADTDAVIPERNPNYKGPKAESSAVSASARAAGPLQGWVPRDCNAAVKDGLLSVTGTNAAPFLGFALGKLGQPGKLRFRVRGAVGEGRLVWMPGVGAPATEVRSTPFTMAGETWHVVAADLPAPMGKTGLMRLYLPAHGRPIAIDWIELVSGDSIRRWDFGGEAAGEGIPSVGEEKGLTTPPPATNITSSWQREATPLLSGFVNMYNPCVVETGGEWRYRMWFFGWAARHANEGMGWGCDAVFHARSRDLKTWEVWCGEGRWDATMTPERWRPVLHASERWYDSWHNGDPSVVLEGGRFYMAYSATSKPFAKTAGYPSDMVQCIMGATSSDGIRWEKTSQPLLIRKEDCAAPRPEPDRIGDFHRPCLRREAGAWKLWFDYWVPGKGVCLGLAVNRGDFTGGGGFALQHDPAEPLLANWPNPEMVRIGGRWHSFADPAGYPVPPDTRPDAAPWLGRQLREAVSDDGIHWRLMDFISPDDDAPACHVPQALVTRVDGRDWLYLFYATQKGYRPDGGRYHYEYDRIRAMRREVAP